MCSYVYLCGDSHTHTHLPEPSKPKPRPSLSLDPKIHCVSREHTLPETQTTRKVPIRPKVDTSFQIYQSFLADVNSFSQSGRPGRLWKHQTRVELSCAPLLLLYFHPFDGVSPTPPAGWGTFPAFHPSCFNRKTFVNVYKVQNFKKKERRKKNQNQKEFSW